MDAATRICLNITAWQAARAVAEYEAIAAEFNFEPYGTPAEEAASYNRHRRSHIAQIHEQIKDLRERVSRIRRAQ